MGMGEPLDNLESVLASLEILTAACGFGFSPARITVSTVGLVPAMLSFLERSRCHLAVSLHSPFEEERRSLMPIENVYPLARGPGRAARALSGRRRRVSFEYILFDGLNDTPRHARELARILHGIRSRINLIPFHPIPDSPLAPSPPERIQAFQARLKSSGFITTLRKSRGLDIAAACGLLSTQKSFSAREPEEIRRLTPAPPSGPSAAGSRTPAARAPGSGSAWGSSRGWCTPARPPGSAARSRAGRRGG